MPFHTTYDAANRLVESKDKTTLAVATSGYDAANRRVKKTSGGATTYYVWDGGQVIAEYDQSGVLQVEYIYLGDRMLAADGGARVFYHQDRLSVRAMTNDTGALLGTQSQLPFGEAGPSVGLSDKRQFTSYERDLETNTDYAVNRQYEPTLGRFTRPDPVPGTLSAPQTLNRYAYVRNDPVDHIDPNGLNLRVCITGHVETRDPSTNTTTAYASTTFCYDLFDISSGGGDYGGGSNRFPGFDNGKLADINRALAKAASILSNPDCQNALASAGINVTDVINKINSIEPRPESNPSSAGYKIFNAEKSTDVQVQAFLKTDKGANAGGFIYGQDVFLRKAFFNARGGARIGPEASQALALIHEAVHLTGPGDKAFGGSAALNDLIVKGCWNKLYGHNDLAFVGS